MSQRGLTADAGRLLRSTRQARGMSQARLAELAGISQQRLSKLEQGAIDPRLGELARLFGGLRLRLRLETAPAGYGAAEDPDLTLELPAEDRLAGVTFLCHLLRKFRDVPHLVAGRLAAVAHGLPVRAARIDLLVPQRDRPGFAAAMHRFSAVRWSECWQEFRDYRSAEQPGPLRWLISESWELRATLVDELPSSVHARLGEYELRVPTPTWLLATDPDLTELLGRLKACGWDRPGVRPVGG